MTGDINPDDLAFWTRYATNHDLTVYDGTQRPLRRLLFLGTFKPIRGAYQVVECTFVNDPTSRDWDTFIDHMEVKP